jgi:hypothetical protein
MAEGNFRTMSRVLHAFAALLLLTAAFAGCGKEKTEAPTEQPAFTFTVYPGARYLAQLTELDKRAATVEKPNQPAPPIAIYDTDAPLDTVANFYVQSYGYARIASDASNNLSAAKPPAYYRTGDLKADVKAIEPVLQKLKQQVDLSKAQGKYRAVEIDSKMNRPRVTIQRPYFDVTQSQVVDRTIILMAP